LASLPTSAKPMPLLHYSPPPALFALSDEPPTALQPPFSTLSIHPSLQARPSTTCRISGNPTTAKTCRTTATSLRYPEPSTRTGPYSPSTPGPMRAHLRHLNGRCPALKHLSLRSVGQDDSDGGPWSARNAEQPYEERASFPQSVTPTCGASTSSKPTRASASPIDHVRSETFAGGTAYGWTLGPSGMYILPACRLGPVPWPK